MSSASMHSLDSSDALSSCPTTLLSLPPELLLLILGHLPPPALTAASHACHPLRQLVTSSPALWLRQLTLTAQTAGLHLRSPPPAQTTKEEATEAEGWLGGACGVPGRAWAEMCKVLERRFVLYECELPKLGDGEWKAICQARFPASVLRKELAKTPPAGASGVAPGRRPKGRYRELFLRTLQRYEHMNSTSCLGHEHSCEYLVLHRVQGLTRNRISTREFDPERIMDELKLQNKLAEYTTVQLCFPPALCPVDVLYSAFVTIGRRESFLKNDAGMTFLAKLGVWDKEGTGQTHAILGPILFAASLRASPGTRRSWDRLPPLSLEVPDLWQVGEPVGAGREWWVRQGVVTRDLDGFV